MKQILQTERLILREYTLADFDALYAILSDPETMKHYPRPYDEKGTMRWLNWSLDNYQKYGFGLWAIELCESGEFIGDCGITMQNIDGEMLPEIGYHIHKKHWRQGYGKEAAAAVRDWCFQNTDFDVIYSYMTHTNVASYSTAASVGMQKIKEYAEPDDGVLHYVYALTRKDWENQTHRRTMMNTLEAIAKRKSTRAYTGEQISEEALAAILKAANCAPVAMARYDSLHITVIQSTDIIKQINDMTAEMFAKRMGVKKNTDFGAKTMVLVSTATEGLPPEMVYANVGIVIENMVLAATSLGIDSVILGGAPSIVAQNAELVKELGIPDGFKPVLGALFGYAQNEEPAKDHTINVNRV